MFLNFPMLRIASLMKNELNALKQWYTNLGWPHWPAKNLFTIDPLNICISKRADPLPSSLVLSPDLEICGCFRGSVSGQRKLPSPFSPSERQKSLSQNATVTRYWQNGKQICESGFIISGTKHLVTNVIDCLELIIGLCTSL